MVDTSHAVSSATGSKRLSIALFCGSSNTTDPAFLEAATQFGRLLAQSEVRLVYGGGGVGLMGRAAKAAHAAGGEVLGVIPDFLRSREVVYDEVETIVVTNMHERKQRMYQASDAFVIMPGGVGTLEEVIELISWRRLNLHAKPIVFVNLNDFWTPFFALIDHTVVHNLTPTWLPEAWRSVTSVEEIVPVVLDMLKTARADESQDVAARF